LNCSNCNKAIQNKDAKFCPYCAKSLLYIQKTTGYRIPAAIFTIISSLITILIGIITFLGLASYISYSFYESFNAIIGLLLFIVNTICFGLGLTVAIFLIKRKNFKFSILGISSLIISGIFTTIGIIIISNGLIFTALLFGIPILAFAVLGIIFTVIAKSEFFKKRES
jgi:DNA-directed RNA polymerase subunit RPC12/RpoP